MQRQQPHLTQYDKMKSASGGEQRTRTTTHLKCLDGVGPDVVLQQVGKLLIFVVIAKPSIEARLLVLVLPLRTLCTSRPSRQIFLPLDLRGFHSQATIGTIVKLFCQRLLLKVRIRIIELIHR